VLLVKVSKDLIELCLHFLNLDVFVFFCRASFPVIPVILIHSLCPSKLLLMAMIIFVIAIAIIIGVVVLILSLSGVVFCDNFFLSLLP